MPRAAGIPPDPGALDVVRIPGGMTQWIKEIGRWRAWWTDGTPLRGDNDRDSYFLSVHSALEAIRAGLDPDEEEIEVAKPNGKKPEPRAEAEICPRADGPFLLRLRFWGQEVRTAHLADGLTVIDVNVAPGWIAALGADLIAGAELKRPDPGKMPKPPKVGTRT